MAGDRPRTRQKNISGGSLGSLFLGGGSGEMVDVGGYGPSGNYGNGGSVSSGYMIASEETEPASIFDGNA